MHRALPLAIWTLSHLGKDTAGYSIAQVPCSLLLSPSDLDVFAIHFSAS